jgi:hypothetical protein
VISVFHETPLGFWCYETGARDSRIPAGCRVGDSMAEKSDEHSGCNLKTPFDTFVATSKPFRMTRRLEDSEE